nr:MAG TPA: hypothetical protein [Caudoviricetes sp.]
MVAFPFRLSHLRPRFTKNPGWYASSFQQAFSFFVW